MKNIFTSKESQKKIKIISENYPTTFEHTVNQFLESHDVVAMQYQPFSNGVYSVMIIYEED